MRTIMEEAATAPIFTADAAKANSKKAHARARRAPAKGKAGKPARPAKKTHTGRTRATVAPPIKTGAREGSKTATILELLRRTGGATSKELEQATNWLPHSVRGFLSGTIRKKMKLAVTSTTGEDGERKYSIEA